MKRKEILVLIGEVLGSRAVYSVASLVVTITMLSGITIILRNDIREIFEGCNIPLDSNSKSSNLCHRFRHGFIMQLLYVKNMPLELAIKYSRHTTVEGLEPYNNPTDEYLISKLNEMNTKYIYNREKS